MFATGCCSKNMNVVVNRGGGVVAAAMAQTWAGRRQRPEHWEPNGPRNPGIGGRVKAGMVPTVWLGGATTNRHHKKNHPPTPGERKGMN